MSSISPLEPMSEYSPERYEEKREEIDPLQAQPNEDARTPVVKAAVEQQDAKTTLNAFQYTGKGSFIDKVF
ncbi:hypothetical protein GM415_13885 [Pseudodesulfovibrio cashew]|uniref:Uncharacterized protein n=1 Tax=Pseudodesulfovibrio cashew TaxID=2678688 RepID=A0A6I6JLR7_9BACT|nr:hypothetical protein [Pseudodesulfovibrio cashew]QGY41173.1 hypothetical protein GM415_13885 [Pseudodesulfovibrio cashew]